MKLHHLMLFIHLAGVIVWVGGMAFAHFCLRPAALELSPAERLGLWSRVLGRFFRIVWVAIGAILISGLAMLPASMAMPRPKTTARMTWPVAFSHSR